MGGENSNFAPSPLGERVGERGLIRGREDISSPLSSSKSQKYYENLTKNTNVTNCKDDLQKPETLV